jgi:hypothetical protein
MSDTFGASDLNADTPGLGPQSGNERGPPVQLPSQLQGLVKHFFQQSQGNPNPKFLPPAPGPGGAQGGQRKPPDLGPLDPPDRVARSLAPLPANAPQPPRKFQPYMPPVPRDQDMWGKPEAYPRLPASFEVHGIYQNLGGYFAQHGAAATAPLGANLAGASKEYIDGYAKGMDLRMRLAKEQAALNAQNLEDLERARSIEYADVFIRHHEMGDDPQALHDDIWKVAVQHGDKDVIAMMEDGASAEKVRRFLASHEAHIRALSAANKKSEDQDVDNAAWGLTPAAEEDKPYDPYGAGATPTKSAAPTSPEAAPSGEKDAGRAPGVGDPADKTKPADPDAEPRETPIEEAGDTVVRGGEPPTGLDPNKKRAALLNGMQKNSRLDQIIGEANSGKIKPEEVLGKVRELSPSIAQELDNTMHYRGTGSTGSTGTGGMKEQEYRGRLASLARLAQPGDAQGIGGWNQSTYKAVSDFREEAQKPNSPLQRVPTAVEAAENLRRDLKAIQDRDGSGADVSPETLSGAMGKDPLYSQLKIDWIRYNEDIDVLTRGSPSVGMAEQAINTQPQIPYFGSIEGYRGAIRRDMDQAYSRVRSYHRTWNSYRTGDAMPAYNPDAEKSMTDIGKMDYTTGAIPGEIIVHPDGSKFRYLGVNPEVPGARENWETAR